MKFSTRQDTDLPQEDLFQAVSDFGRLERMLARRGARVQRIDTLSDNAVGMGWNIGFDWRGRSREILLKVTGYDQPDNIQIAGESDLFNVIVQMTTLALTPSKSRLIFETDIQPRGMKARLLLQTAKLGKSQLDRKFAFRIAELVSDLTGSQRR